MLIGRTKTILDLRIGTGSVMKSGKVLWKGRTWQSAASWKTRRELTESGGGEYVDDVEAKECGNGDWRGHLRPVSQHREQTGP